ncbi:uncharacterized protein LOC116344294 [Contarinia nasturtii]|uniref:uncharacterized protein LOC116344294 n=1 Tax=Contarinia nasturtii TaxID=265458 RepID=UPI0012D4A235|nr:uncharacterized protein LOC116344294 [Contarinia nasturtii]
MNLFLITCVFAVALTPAMGGIASSSLLLSDSDILAEDPKKLLPNLDTLSGGEKVFMLNNKGFPQAQAYAGARRVIKGSLWLEKCCGMKGSDYSKSVRSIADNFAAHQEQFALYDILGPLNDVFKGFVLGHKIAPDYVYSNSQYKAAVKLFDTAAVQLKAEHDKMSTLLDTKRVIEKVCVDLHTNMCYLKGYTLKPPMAASAA